MSARPVVAIVGRPNVGKSSLLNRLVGQRVAIVHDEPGVTRDRHYADAWGMGRPYIVVDTGGLDPESDDPMTQRIGRQVAIAVQEADVVVCVLDATTGPTNADREAVKLLRSAGKPVIYAANKADGPAAEAEISEMYRLGIDHVLAISALHGRGIGELERSIIAALPPLAPDDVAVAEGGPIRIALIGRPNAGKSSLVNRLAGTDRVIVDAAPGTTRDPIDTMVERGGHRYLLVDTAGIRRKGKVARESSPVEAVSVLHAMRAVERCQVAVLVCDAAEGVAEQDAKVLGMAVDRNRAIVIALNKLDLLPDARGDKLEVDARDKLSFVPWAPIVRVSATTGRGVDNLLVAVRKVHTDYKRRVGTGELNRFFEGVLALRPPPTMSGRSPRLNFITQVESAPPLFVIMTNEPEHIHFSYQRFVTNQIRKTFGFEGVPIRVSYKKKRRRGDL